MRKYLTEQRFKFVIYLYICLELLARFWHFGFSIYPTFLIVLLWLLFYQNNRNFSIDVIDLAIILLFVFEFMNYLCSSYRENSYLFFKDFTVLVLNIFFLKSLFKEHKYQFFIVFLISFIALVLCNIDFRQFMFCYFEVKYYGFNDFSPFRFIYTPMGLVSNEWVTILLAFLPFVLSTFTYFCYKQNTINGDFLKHPILKYFFGSIVLLLILNLFISFSRGGYLAFTVFVLLIDLLLILYKQIKVKSLIIGNLILSFYLAGLILYFYPTLKSTFNSSISLKRSSIGRIDQWNSTRSDVKNYPLLGCGSKNYALINTVYRSKRLDTNFTGRVNNTYLQILIEKGIIGSCIYFLILLIFIYYSLKKISKAKNVQKKALSIFVLASVISVLLRELFFSSIFYNSGLLFLIFILFLLNTSDADNIWILKKFPHWVLTIIIAFMAFMIHLNLTYQRDEKHLNKLVSTLNNKNYNSAIALSEKFDCTHSNNSLLVSTSALAYYGTIKVPILFDNLILEKYVLSDSISAYKAKCSLLKAISLNPYDDLYYHNLAWIYFRFGEIDSAIFSINRAITISSNTSMYYISKGLFLERINLKEAKNNYIKAIKLSPEIIDSKFFLNLEKRGIQKPDSLLMIALNELLDYQKDHYSSIIQTRIGKLYINLGDTDRAFKIFLQVSNELPNLNRVWHYLGLIYKQRGEFEEMKKCFNKSLFLDNRDYLTRIEMARYYSEISDTCNMKYYIRTAQSCYKNRKSEHSLRSFRIYNQESSDNDIIPTDLQSYILPNLDGLTVNK